jgi:hypothetical protein
MKSFFLCSILGLIASSSFADSTQTCLFPLHGGFTYKAVFNVSDSGKVTDGKLAFYFARGNFHLTTLGIASAPKKDTMNSEGRMETNRYKITGNNLLSEFDALVIYDSANDAVNTAPAALLLIPNPKLPVLEGSCVKTSAN